MSSFSASSYSGLFILGPAFCRPWAACDPQNAWSVCFLKHGRFYTDIQSDLGLALSKRRSHREEPPLQPATAPLLLPGPLATWFCAAWLTCRPLVSGSVTFDPSFHQDGGALLSQVFLCSSFISFLLPRGLWSGLGPTADSATHTP